MKKLNVAVIYGGVSPEHMISRSSANTIISNLSSEKYNIIPIYINKEGTWFAYDNYGSNLKNFKWEQIGVPVTLSVDHLQKGLFRIIKDKAKLVAVDVIFPVLHGLNGEDGNIQGLFEIAGIPYVGCNVATSAICADKSFMRAVAKNISLPQTRYLVFTLDDYQKDKEKILEPIENKLGYPCFIKPCNGGSSIGMTKAKDKNEVVQGIELALNYDKKIIVEKAIVGREFECSVLEDDDFGQMRVSCVGEVKQQSEFYTYDAKYMDKTSYTVIPADLPKRISQKIRDYSLKMFEAVSGNGLSRIDFFVEDGTNKVIFNEINTMPGFTSISMYPKLWENEGVKLENLLDILIESAFKKSSGGGRKIWSIEQ